MRALRFTLAIALVASVLSPAWARSFRVGQLPNGNSISCSACHVNPGGGGSRNAFGQLVERSFLSGGNVVWGPLLASLDADGDGVPNGVELQDRFGEWQTGQPNPGNVSLVSAPGNASANFIRDLTLQFSDMTPHVGHPLYIRVIDKSTGMETARTMLPSILAASFDVTLPALLDGRSYRVDFFADANSNGLYDVPPVDHVWQLNVDNVSGDVSVPFAHHGNFVDTGWKYALNLNLTGMSPHLGQLVELRVIDQSTDLEVGRTRVENLGSAASSLMIPCLQVGPSYTVHMYADLNRNGLYDAPPTDHAWQLSFNNTTGDVDLDFAHNTTFTDVQWQYLMQMNLLGMDAHVGQLFELRVTNTAGNQEIGRTSVAAVQQADYSVFVPGVARSMDYRADFYADMNGSGTYDAPPADHAWRVAFSNTTGNVVQNFVHNTDFTDIAWPGLSVEEPISSIVPENLSLYQNYPNPFNPATNIRFDLTQSGSVALEVFNLVGQKVAELVNGPLGAGSYNVSFNAGALPSGVYVYRLAAGGQTVQKKMMLLK